MHVGMYNTYYMERHVYSTLAKKDLKETQNPNLNTPNTQLRHTTHNIHVHRLEHIQYMDMYMYICAVDICTEPVNTLLYIFTHM